MYPDYGHFRFIVTFLLHVIRYKYLLDLFPVRACYNLSLLNKKKKKKIFAL